MAGHVLQAGDFRLEFDAAIFDSDIDSPVNAYLFVRVKNDDYCGSAQLEIDIKQFAAFVTALKGVYDSLKGSARLAEPYGNSGEITFAAETLGHISVSGYIGSQQFRNSLKTNKLYFHAEFDQTFMQPFLNGLVKEYSHYERC